MSFPREVLELWSAFFYVREPATTIALFRILFSLLLLANAMLFARQARLWIGERGVLPRARFLEAFGHTRLTLLAYLPPADVWVVVLLSAHVLAAVSLLLGFQTRLAAALSFLTLASIQHRNPLVLYGADSVWRILCFLLIFSRAGEVGSIDGWLASRSGHTVGDTTAWCTRLMQLQISLIYLKAFVAKLRGATWREGSAAYYAAEAEGFRRTRLPRFARGWLCSRLATWSTLAVELALGTLLWVPALRYPVLLAGVMLHLLMDVFLNLQLFGVTMIVCLTLFIEPEVLDPWVGVGARVATAPGLGSAGESMSSATAWGCRAPVWGSPAAWASGFRVQVSGSPAARAWGFPGASVWDSLRRQRRSSPRAEAAGPVRHRPASRMSARRRGRSLLPGYVQRFAERSSSSPSFAPS